MRFTKMHGTGNDFIVIDNIKDPIPEDQLSAISRHACDRHFGIGSDGVILVLPSRVANFRMRMFNPDVTEAEMCGNGIRCFAKYVYDRKLHQSTDLTIETLDGIKTLKLNTSGSRVETVQVEMGKPKLKGSQIPVKGGGDAEVIGGSLRAGGKKLEITCVNMGNPHCAIFVPNTQTYPVEKIGPQVETHTNFPQRTNVEFIEVLNTQEIKVRVWERGAGETLACGTGACASAVASVLNEKTSRKVTVHLLGGDLFIEWLGDGQVRMTGPAKDVFDGKVGSSQMKKWGCKSG